MAVAGINVVINLGTDRDGDTVKEYLESKYGSVEVIDLTVRDGKLVDKEGDDHARSILRRVDAHSKITISGQHSNLYGETLQMEAGGRDGISITERTRHYSDIVQFLGERIESDQFHSPSKQLSISVLSCYAGVGDKKSLAAKMQRMFAAAHNIYTSITARTFLVYIDKPCYSVSLEEYRSIQIGRKKNTDFRMDGHQKYKSKMLYYWGESGEQRVCDAYPYRNKIKDRIVKLCNSIESNSPKVMSILDKLRSSFESPESMGYIYDLLLELHKALPLKSREKLKEVLHYAEKHFDVIPINQEIDSPVTAEERESFKFIEQILDEKLKDLSDQPYAGIKKLIRDHYIYNFKKQFKTDHLDQIIEDLKATPLQSLAIDEIKNKLNDFVVKTPEEPQIQVFFREDSPVRSSRECEAAQKKREFFRSEIMEELDRIKSSQ